MQSKNTALFIRLLDDPNEKIVFDAIGPFKGEVLTVAWVQ
jgi:hypothetical protein